jgi:dihydroorotate dehydrogenase electron transfer subunit
MMTGPEVLRIVEHYDENDTCRTMRFDRSMGAQPGQFMMIWIPGVDELPMSVSHIGERFGITYKIVGNGTERLASLSIGDMLGVRGPYGRGFSVKNGRSLVVAGGTGMACLAPLVEACVAAGNAVDVVLGARTASELLMSSRGEKAGAKMHIVTDDGSEGTKGFATDAAEKLIGDHRFDQLYSCGPEKMLTRVLELARNRGLPLQASIERYMKCGIGLCDSCAIDGKHVCTDGPVFSDEELASFTELGKMKLSRSGTRTPVE